MSRLLYLVHNFTNFLTSTRSLLELFDCSISFHFKLILDCSLGRRAVEDLFFHLKHSKRLHFMLNSINFSVQINIPGIFIHPYNVFFSNKLPRNVSFIIFDRKCCGHHYLEFISYS